MTLVAKMFWIIKLALVSVFVCLQEKPTAFVYMNHPETLMSTGILHEKTFKADTQSRYFFHYKNGTSKGQKLHIQTKNTVNNLKKSINSHERPEISGSLTTKQFLSAPEENKKLDFTTYLEPNITLTGIIEGKFSKNDTIVFKFGNSENKLDTFTTFQNEYIFNHFYDLKLNNNITYKLGAREENLIPGQYGQTINLNIKPTASGIMKISFSPRGGSGLLIFSHRGKIYTTKLLSAQKEYDVMMISVEKNKIETFSFIPIGGLNYPINIYFSLHDTLLEKSLA